MGKSGQKKRVRAKARPRRNDSKTASQHPLMKIATRLPKYLIGVVIVLLIPAPFTSDWPALNILYERFLGPMIIGAVVGSILIASVAGAAVMMGWRAGVVGLVFTASLVAACVGVVEEDALWTNLGVIGFALSCAGYYMIGELSGFLPVKSREAYGAVAMVPGGIIMGIVGINTDSQMLVMFGFGGAGAALGVAAATWWRRRRLRAAPATATSPIARASGRANDELATEASRS